MPWCIDAATFGDRRSRSGVCPYPVGSFVPRGYVTHRVLGHRGDREARIHAEVRRDDGSVDDVEIRISVRAALHVDDTVIGRESDRTTAEDVSGRCLVEEDLEEPALRNAI